MKKIEQVQNETSDAGKLAQRKMSARKKIKNVRETCEL